MPYRPARIGEFSVRESARVAAESGDEKAKAWLLASKGHRKRQRAESREARRKRVVSKKARS